MASRLILPSDAPKDTSSILVKSITGRIKPDYWPGKQEITYDFSPVVPHVIRVWCKSFPSNIVVLNLKTCEASGSITMEDTQEDARKKSEFVVTVSNKGKSYRVDDKEHLPFWLKIDLVTALMDDEEECDGSD